MGLFIESWPYPGSSTAYGRNSLFTGFYGINVTFRTQRWVLWAIWEWVLILSAIKCATLWPLLIPIVLLVIGSRQHALAVLGHEGVHRSVHDTNLEVNDNLTNILALWPVMLDTQAYRNYHLPHHTYLGNKEKDPEIEQRQLFNHNWTNLTLKKKIRIILSDLIGLNWKEAISLFKRLQGKITKNRVVYLVILVSFLSLLCGGILAPLLYVISLLTSTVACARARMWREHVAPNGVNIKGTNRYKVKWWERILYLPHYSWKHADHHAAGRWNVPAWEL